MNRRSLWAGLLAMGTGLATMGCGPSLTDLYMAEDQSGKIKTTTFDDVETEIYVIIRLNGGNEDTVLSLTLDGPDGIVLEEEEIFPHPNSDSSGAVDVSIQLIQIDAEGMVLKDGPWPTGEYKVDVDLDGEFEETTDFKIRTLQ